MKGEQEAETTISYFKPKKPSEWRRNVPTYQTVSLGELYAGIELKLRAYGNRVEKLFYVQPGASPEMIQGSIKGARNLRVSEEGHLEIETGLGAVRFTKPAAYQEVNGNRKDVEVAYTVEGDEYGFAVGPYDPAEELIIDPLLAFTYLGGSTYDHANAIAVGPGGNVYATGWTIATDFPVTTGAYDVSGDYVDVFVSKLDADLQTLAASTYLGGTGADWARSMAVDSAGDVYLVGMTDSGDFPTTGSAYDPDFDGGDGFVAKLSADLADLLASTYLGGSDSEMVHSIAISTTLSGQNVYVTCRTESSDFPTTTVSAYAGEYDAFISGLDGDLQNLLASTYLGGSDNDVGRSISVITGSGLAYITQIEQVGDYVYAVNGSRYLYVLDPNDPRGEFQIAETYALPGEKPSGLAWDGANLRVSDEETGRIYKIPGDALGGRSYDLMDDYLRPEDTPTNLPNWYTVYTDTTLTQEGSPYVVQGGISVQAGGTLTIAPGVRLLFPEYAGLSVGGRGVAVGTPQEPIVFSHVDPDTRWSGIMVDASGDPSQPKSIFRHCRVQHAERGIESRNAPIDVERCWMRGMPTGLNAPPSGIQIEVVDGGDARVVGNVSPNVAMYLGDGGGGGNPAQVEVADNRGSGIFLRGGYTADPTHVQRNLLDGGVVVEGAGNLRIEGNQLGRPLECSPTAEGDVEFSGNLIETDYQINIACNDGTHFTATHNAVTKGFAFGWTDPNADLLELTDVHHNNILGGANYFLPAEINASSSQTIDLSLNWWGTTDPGEVRELINDHEDDPNRGTAISEPLLEAPDPHGFVRGRVFDAENGRPLAEAAVEAGGYTTTVGSDGYFAMTVPSGTYTVTAAAGGYQTATLEGFTVAAASVTHLEAGLVSTSVVTGGANYPGGASIRISAAAADVPVGIWSAGPAGVPNDHLHRRAHAGDRPAGHHGDPHL